MFCRLSANRLRLPRRRRLLSQTWERLIWRRSGYQLYRKATLYPEKVQQNRRGHESSLFRSLLIWLILLLCPYTQDGHPDQAETGRLSFTDFETHPLSFRATCRIFLVTIDAQAPQTPGLDRCLFQGLVQQFQSKRPRGTLRQFLFLPYPQHRVGLNEEQPQTI